MVGKAATLFLLLLCLLPPLYLSYRLPTLHTVTDNKWLVVLGLSLGEVALIALTWALRPTRPILSNRPISALKVSLLAGAVAFAAAHVISAFFSREPGFSLRAGIPTLVLVALFCAILTSSAAPAEIHKHVSLLAATGTLVGLCALLQHKGFDPLARLVRYREVDRYRTGVYVTFGNPEYLAGYLAPMALVAAGLAIRTRQWWTKTLSGAAMVVTGTAALMTGSRGAFLGLFGGTIFLCIGSIVFLPSLSNRGVRRWILLAIFAGLASGVAILFWSPNAGPLNRLRGRLAQLASPYSVQNRIIFNLVGVQMVANRPVMGMGPGMYGPDFYRFFSKQLFCKTGVTEEMFARSLDGRVPEHAHNDWLEIWIESGLLGIAAWIWLLATWGVAVVRRLIKQSAASEKLFLLALACAVVAILINGLFNFPLHEPTRAIVFWLLLAWSAKLT